MSSEHPSHASKAPEEDTFEGAGASRRLPRGATAAAGAGASEAVPSFGDAGAVVRSMASEAVLPAEGRTVYRSHTTFDPVAHMGTERSIAASGDASLSSALFEDREVLKGMPMGGTAVHAGHALGRGAAAGIDAAAHLDAPIGGVKYRPSAGLMAPGHVSATPPPAPTIFPPTVPMYPVPLDTSTCVVHDCEAAAIQAIVSEQLAGAGVVREFDADTCQFRCVHFEQGMDTHFRIFLYTVGEGGRDFAIEFQKRRGDSFLYNRIKLRVWEGVDTRFPGRRESYKRPEPPAGAALGAAAQVPFVSFGPVLPAAEFDPSTIKMPAPLDIASLMMPAEPSTPTSEIDAFPSEADDPPAALEGETAEDTVELLTGMLTSSEGEVVSMGVRAAAMASLENRLHERLCSPAVLSCLANVLSGQSAAVLRMPGEETARPDPTSQVFAATTVANLAENRHCQAAIAEHPALMPALARNVADTSVPETTHTRRECTRAITNLVLTQRAAVEQVNGGQALRLATTSDDLITKQQALRAVGTLHGGSIGTA